MRRIEILDMEPDDKSRFHCFVDGFMENLSIERIKQAVAEGATLTQRSEHDVR